jgi:2-phospho-L-lactate guanylyltransferase (CobY/MobA/RfbA family)
MLADVRAACRAADAQEVIVADAPGGQGEAVEGALLGREGPVTIVNGDVPAVTPEELAALNAAAPAIVAAEDGTTNAIALRDARQFVSLYGRASAARFEEALDATRLDLPGLRDDVDTPEDLERIRDRLGDNTRRQLGVRV